MGKSGKNEKKFIWQRKKTENENNNAQTQDLLQNKDVENGTSAPSAADQGGGFQPPDGGWGWIVCLTSLWANGTVFGIINTFGIVYVHMREHYSKDNPEVSLRTGTFILIL